MINRRRFLQALAALGVASAHPARAQVVARPRFAKNPFSLGVASGYPLPQSVALWTRLAPYPDAPGGGLAPETIPVRWELAHDQAMKNLVASGTAYASAAWGHSVHVEVFRLEPGRWYWYRFTAGEAQSPVGRTRTAPATNANPDRLRFAVASCQHYEQGYFGAYRHIVADEPDLVLHLGDYIYESSRSGGGMFVRPHGTPEPHTLEDYRARIALYKLEPELQAAHAACPWLVTWDDHEVENDYADGHSENADPVEWFLARRAAAYQAYYEHMPMRRQMVPAGPRMRVYSRSAFGGLAQFHLLDDRQYRSPQSCPPPARGGSTVVDVAACTEMLDPKRQMLGAEQETWLNAGLSGSRAKWNILAQQTLMAQFDQQPGPGRRAWTDGWDGYPAARRRLLESVRDRKAANPVVLGGDVHCFYAADLKVDFDDPQSPVVASELVGTSITSESFSQERIQSYLPENPHVKYAEARHRGYLRVEVTPSQLRADMRGMDTVQTRESPCSTLASWVVEDGKPGPLKA
jgi:alkaline phosphatase D